MPVKYNGKILGNSGIVGRFRPLHRFSEEILKSVCKNADHVTIGIGSSNKYDERNPFTPKEAEGMIRAALQGITNYDIVHLPDFAHLPEYRDGQKWVDNVKKEFGDLDTFVTGNNYVFGLLNSHYTIVHPFDLIKDPVLIKGTEVRLRIAQKRNWAELVSSPVEQYIRQHKLDSRLRREFGPKVIENASKHDYRVQSRDAEARRVYGE